MYLLFPRDRLPWTCLMLSLFILCPFRSTARNGDRCQLPQQQAASSNLFPVLSWDPSLLWATVRRICTSLAHGSNWQLKFHVYAEEHLQILSLVQPSYSQTWYLKNEAKQPQKEIKWKNSLSGVFVVVSSMNRQEKKIGRQRMGVGTEI